MGAFCTLVKTAVTTKPAIKYVDVAKYLYKIGLRKEETENYFEGFDLELIHSKTYFSSFQK